MFSPELTYALEASLKEATQRQNAYFCVEHILYCLTFNDHIQDILHACGADVEGLRKQLSEYFEQGIEKTGSANQPPEQTPAVQRLLHRALLHVRSSGKDTVTAQEVLVAVFAETDSFAKYALENQQVTRLDVLNYISH